MKRGMAQPFTLLLASYFGRSSLKTVKSLEAQTQVVPLHGKRLYIAMYINELLYRLLQAETACDGLFECYQRTLISIARDEDPQKALRLFELTLLETLGYGINFDHDVYSDEIIESGFQYQYQQQLGFFAKQAICKPEQVYDGQDIINLSQRELDSEATLKMAKRFCRQALANLLGDKPLHSRALFAGK